jgi:hypothetical protein
MVRDGMTLQVSERIILTTRLEAGKEFAADLGSERNVRH